MPHDQTAVSIAHVDARHVHLGRCFARHFLLEILDLYVSSSFSLLHSYLLCVASLAVAALALAFAKEARLDDEVALRNVVDNYTPLHPKPLTTIGSTPSSTPWSVSYANERDELTKLLNFSARQL